MVAADDSRAEELRAWAAALLQRPELSIEPASEDASFRRYLRLRDGDRSWIGMDAPPEQEELGPFLAVAQLLRSAGLRAPAVHGEDRARGFLLLDDLGDTLYLAALRDDPTRADALYAEAIAALVGMQVGITDLAGLPPYDEALMAREMDLFADWLVGRHLADDPEVELDASYLALRTELLATLPRLSPVFVHRDYHSRNLMLLDDAGPGILDFQDAVAGPASYDLVSLLRDCYITWPSERVDAWLDGYHAQAIAAGLALPPLEVFRREFDLMGVQRHLKAAGIFCRLHHRDGKSGFLADLPRTLGYIVHVAGRRREVVPLAAWLEQQVIPALARVAAGP